MQIISRMEQDGFEQVIYCTDSSVGLKAIIALHSTVLGPATGGLRMWNYASETEALSDVLRLARGMTYKNSVAGLDWGGGKAVLIGDSKQPKNPKMFERFGEFVQRLGGNYITAKDVGTKPDDLRAIKRKTKHILGIEGEPNGSGDPSPATAWGVYHGMRACAEFVHKTKSLKGMKVALQGLGSVSFSLMEHLTSEGASIIGCDIDAATIERAVSKFKIEVVSPESIYDVKCDIFSPSALGATLNTQTIPRITAKIIAGAANNQLATSQDGVELMKRGIVYAPDYVINGGGVINIYYESPERGGYVKDKAFQHIARIEQTIAQILDRGKTTQTPSFQVADRMAEERIEKALQGKRA